MIVKLWNGMRIALAACFLAIPLLNAQSELLLMLTGKPYFNLNISSQITPAPVDPTQDFFDWVVLLWLYIWHFVTTL